MPYDGFGAQYGEEPLADWELDLLTPEAREAYKRQHREEVLEKIHWVDPYRGPKVVITGVETGKTDKYTVEEVRPPAHPTLAKIAEVKKKDGWDWYWLFWIFGMVITGFAIPEANAVLNKQKGDTLSENIREWLKTDTPGGGASWLAIVGVLFTVLTWLMGHILEWWP